MARADSYEVGQVLNTKSFGEIQVLEYNNYKSIKVMFLNTGNEQTVTAVNIKNGALQDKILIQQRKTDSRNSLKPYDLDFDNTDIVKQIRVLYNLWIRSPLNSSEKLNTTIKGFFEYWSCIEDPKFIKIKKRFFRSGISGTTAIDLQDWSSKY